MNEQEVKLKCLELIINKSNTLPEPSGTVAMARVLVEFIMESGEAKESAEIIPITNGEASKENPDGLSE